MNGFALYQVSHYQTTLEVLLSVIQCGLSLRFHKRVKRQGSEALTPLFHAYSSWDRAKEISEEWMHWVHTALNQKSNDPTKGEMLSIELILGRSTHRISAVGLTPVSRPLNALGEIMLASWNNMGCAKGGSGRIWTITSRGECVPA